MGYILLSAGMLVADILTKILAKIKLEPRHTIPLWDDVFHLTYVENRGIAFGMFGGGRIVFIILTILVLGGLLWFFRKSEVKTCWLRFGTGLVVSGAIGNLIDRIFRGYVVDFLDFRLIDFPVFNVADIAVCVGAAMLVIHCFISDEKREDESVGTETDLEHNEGA